MKKASLLMLALAIFSISQAQLKVPAPSTNQTIKQEFGISNIELSYSRPGIKGRKVFGDLVPFGNVWRTGANGATTVTFGDDVTINGTTVPAGKYGLLSIPDKSNWTIIVSKQTDVTSPGAYKQDMDVVRVTAPVSKEKSKTETFTINFQNITNTTCDVVICWDKSSVKLPVTVEYDGKVMKNISEAIAGEKPPYFQAATYYLNNGKDLNQALSWFNKAVEANPSAFWIQHQKANCLAKLGKFVEAKTTAETSLDLAKKANNGDYVKLNETLLKQIAKSL